MPRPKSKTRRSQIKPLGVSERLGEAPPSHYEHGATGSTRPDKDSTYAMPDGSEHRWDGKCHDDCENLR